MFYRVQEAKAAVQELFERCAQLPVRASRIIAVCGAGILLHGHRVILAFATNIGNSNARKEGVGTITNCWFIQPPLLIHDNNL